MKLKIQKEPQAVGVELLNLMKQNINNEFDPENEIVEILETNINAVEFDVSNDAAELLPEYYPCIFE